MFQTGSVVDCLIVIGEPGRAGSEVGIVKIEEPSIHHLSIAVMSLSAVFREHMGPSSAFVCSRFGKLWRVSSDQDVSRLTKDTELWLCAQNISQPLVALSAAPLYRSEYPCLPSPVPRVTTDGVLDSLRKNGYARISLGEEIRLLVQQVYDSFAEFLSHSEKETFTFSSVPGKQPPFGWKRTELAKEYFVCRPVPEDIWPKSAFRDAALKAFHALGLLSQEIMTQILKQADWTSDAIEELLKESILETRPFDQLLPFSSMIECFRYDGLSTTETLSHPPSETLCRVPCESHQDVSLLTIIPSTRGLSGVQIYNWDTKSWHLEENSIDSSSDALIFAGDLFAHILPDIGVAPAQHRVVIPHVEGYRYSCPFELLPSPSYITPSGDPSHKYISSISRSLRSVNY